MPNVTTLAILAVVFMVAVAGAGYKGYRLGSDAVHAEYAKRDLQQANEAAAFTKATEEKYRAQEQAHSQALAQVSATYEGKLTDAQAKTTLALNAIRSGSIRLRDPAAKPEACGSSAAEAGTAASGRNGSSAGELSADASGFLYSEAARADAYTEQLTACQAALVADRQ